MDCVVSKFESPVKDYSPQDKNEPEQTYGSSSVITPVVEGFPSIDDVPPTSAGVEEASNGPAQNPHLLLDLNMDASLNYDEIEKPTEPSSPSGSKRKGLQYQTTEPTEKIADANIQQSSKPCFCLDRLTKNYTRCITISGIKGIFTYDNLHHHMKIYGPVIKLRIRYDFHKNQSEVLVIFE